MIMLHEETGKNEYVFLIRSVAKVNVLEIYFYLNLKTVRIVYRIIYSIK